MEEQATLGASKSDVLHARFKHEGMSKRVVMDFQQIVLGYYEHHARTFPWREDASPYRVFISEVMLQQTQAGSRTIEKFNAFIKRFPNFASLAAAPLADVLTLWQGLGYNRRALALKKTAEIIVRDYGGELPRTVEELDALPGIGHATACSISAFAFDAPVVFIETNVRNVFIHHFFSGRADVYDAELVPLVTAALAGMRSGEWYSALMDYGSMLKKVYGNASRRSKHYAKQSVFEGSDRQLRGAILRLVSQRGSASLQDLGLLHDDGERIERLVEGLVKEQMLIKDGSLVRIA